MNYLSLFGINRVTGRRGRSLWKICVYLLIGLLMTGCAFSRTITITPFQAESKSMVQLPLSVRVELKEVKQENPNSTTPIFVNRESLKEILITYLNTRNIFHSVLDSPSDSILNVDVRYHLTNYDYFDYIVNMHATLISKDGLDLGNFSGQGIVKGVGSRFTAETDSVSINKAMKYAIEDLCLKIEEEARRQSEEARRKVEETAFANEAKRYRELLVKPALPEDVQRYRVVAEDAFNNKDFEKALEYYRKGLTIEPLWPQGQFNAAMLAGELQRYKWAALYMKRYLELVPDAANAKVAREKMYLWEEKAKETPSPSEAMQEPETPKRRVK